ncbi:MAG: type II toxin-antitoxin system HicA family toxin [Nitrospirae bacterium]|nr:type II toxin-antitoxin system HicA family toxin [Nitrospirota bacterium]
MSKLTVLTAKEAIEDFEKTGWLKDRQKGSHVTLIKEGANVVQTVPLHKEINKGLLRSLIRKATHTMDEFIDLFKL